MYFFEFCFEKDKRHRNLESCNSLVLHMLQKIILFDICSKKGELIKVCARSILAAERYMGSCLFGVSRVSMRWKKKSQSALQNSFLLPPSR